MNSHSPIDPVGYVEEEPLTSREAASSTSLRKYLAAIGAAFLLLFALAAIVPIGGAVIGSGRVGIETRVKRIAHPTGGVIEQIFVTNGQRVAAGDLLMRLDDRVSGADALYSSLTVEQLLAQRARLEAERVDAGQIIFPPELLGNGTASGRKAIEDELRLFEIRRREQQQLRAQLGAKVSQLNSQIGGYQAQVDALRRQRALIEPERRSVQDLWDKQLVTINRVNQLERTAADLEGNIASLQAQIAGVRAQITETTERNIQLGETRRAEAGEQLAQVNAALNTQQTRSVAAGDQQDRSEIRSPYSGTVEKIAFSAVGEVVRPAEPIMEIVPVLDRMVVEATVEPEDVDQVSIGQRATVRFSSFNRSATPEINGRVVYVAADRSEDPNSQRSFFLVRIEVDPREIVQEGFALRSGMPVEVYIQTGNRSLLSYVFKPLRDQLARAFRDN